MAHDVGQERQQLLEYKEDSGLHSRQSVNARTVLFWGIVARSQVFMQPAHDASDVPNIEGPVLKGTNGLGLFAAPPSTFDLFCSR